MKRKTVRQKAIAAAKRAYPTRADVDTWQTNALRLAAIYGYEACHRAAKREKK